MTEVWRNKYCSMKEERNKLGMEKTKKGDEK